MRLRGGDQRVPMAMTSVARRATTAQPRVAIVGAGLMGRWHAHAAVRAGGRVTAIIDVHPSRSAQLAARFPGCTAAAEMGPSLGVVDVVHICTPAASHVTLAREVLEAGRHVLIEKPLASTAADTSALLQLAEARGVLLCPVHQFVFQHGTRTAMARLLSGGSLRHVDMTMCSAGATDADDAGRDRIAEEVLPHPLSLLQRMLPMDVSELDWIVRRPLPGEIRALAQADAVTVSIVVSMSGRPTVNRAVLVGTGETIELDLFHGYAATYGGAVSRARKIAQPFARAATLATAAGVNLARRALRRQAAYPGLQELVQHFYRAVRAGGESPITPRETLAVALALERLVSASARG